MRLESAHRLFARVEITLQQDCLHRPERISDPALKDFDKFASDTGHVHKMNFNLRRQEACKPRAVTSDDVDVTARLETPLAESV